MWRGVGILGEILQYDTGLSPIVTLYLKSSHLNADDDSLRGPNMGEVSLIWVSPVAQW